MAGVYPRQIRTLCAALALALCAFGWTLPVLAQQNAPLTAETIPTIPNIEPAPDQDLVVDVRVEGNRTVSQAKVFQQIETRIGRPFKKDVVERDVKQLASRGWFLDVRPYIQDVLGGRVVIFRVTERPTLRYVEYLGNANIRDKPLSKQTGLKVGDAVDPYAVEEGRRKILEYYHERGYNKVQVEIKEGVNPHDSGAVYVINEGPRERISSVQFIGNTIASDGRLKTQIQSKPGILWVFKGFVDRKKIDEDVDRLTAYYRSLGFFRARVGRELDFGDTGWLSLTYVIDEGPRFKVRSVSFVGNKEFRTDDLSKDVKLQAGEFFNQDKMNLDLGTLRDIYGSYGYVFADIKASPRTLEAQPELDLVYDIEEGGRYRVGQIRVHIEGENPHTRTKAVLNRVSLRTGDVMDVRELRNSERRLKASSIFNTDPTGGQMPTITFSPPEAEELQNASREGGFRGQSPDPEPDGRQSVIVPSDQMLIVSSRQPRTGAIDFDLYVARQYSPPVEDEAGVQPVSYQQTVQSHYSPASAGTGTQQHVSPATAPYQNIGNPIQMRAQSPVQNAPYNNPQPNYAAQPSPYGNQSAYGGVARSTSGPGGAPAIVPAQYTTPANPQYVSQPVTSGMPATNPAPGGVGTTGGFPVTGSFNGQPAFNGAGYNGAGPPVAYGGTTPGVPAQQVAMIPSGADGQYPPLFTQPYDQQPYYEETPANPYDSMPQIPLDVVVSETQTGRFMVGVGVNSNAGVVGSVTIDERNFDWTRVPTSWEDLRSGNAWRGAGQRFRVELMPGTQVQRYLVSFQEPYLLDTPISFGLSGYFFSRNYLEWDEQRLGGRVSLGYQLTPDLSTTFAYRGENVNISHPIVPTPIQISNALGDNVLHGFKLSAAHDTRDSAFLATEGHYIEIGGEQVIGTYEYARAEIEAKQYFMLHQRPDGSGRHVVSVTGQAGFSGTQTPVYDNFFAGGFSTLRGFSFRGASPQVNGAVVGGRFMAIGSVEYLFPVTANDMLRGVVFTDFGTVEPDVQIENFRVAPGVGLRVTVPALGPAPIALDFAVPVLKASYDREQVFSFNIGFLR